MMTSRDVARRVLGRIAEGSYATLALGGELERSELGPADRALATELTYGVLRWRLRLDHALAACAPHGINRLDTFVLDTLRLAAYQILFLRVADYSAVDDAVEAVKRRRGVRLGGFANALLRRLAREGEPALPGDPIERLSVAESAPRWLIDRAFPLLGDDESPDFLAALNRPPPVWLRTNTLRVSRGELIAALGRERPRAEIAGSSLAPEAVAVHQGGDLSATRAFAEGWFTIQDLGAQLVTRLVGPRPGERVLDACAGVGTKSTHLAALGSDQVEIDAADVSERKVELARDQARRLGIRSIRTVTVDLTTAGGALRAEYDRLLLDAPCSGLGVLRRHPERKWQTPSITDLAALQGQLLEALARRVRPGGLLVYAVCTFTDEEGPGQIARFRAAHPEFTIEPPGVAFEALQASDGAVRTWPHRQDADAFYAVRLRRS